MIMEKETLKKRSHKEFTSMVIDLLDGICPDVCDFDDVPQFSREFGALCEKYRERCGLYS